MIRSMRHNTSKIKPIIPKTIINDVAEQGVSKIDVKVAVMLVLSLLCIFKLGQ